jgi:hypothetical protein
MRGLIYFFVLVLAASAAMGYSDGCVFEGRAYPYGGEYIVDGRAMFCGLDNNLHPQKQDGEACNNDGECINDICSEGRCVNILSGIKRIEAISNKIVGGSIPSGTNTKDTSKFSDREVFVISSSNWRDVLMLVPVTVWTEGTAIKKYPALIFYDEGQGFDADSIVYFMQQYQNGREHATIVGDTPQELLALIASPGIQYGAKLGEANVKRINVNDLPSYWKSFTTVVYSQDDYETALLASTVASITNSPLVIAGSSLDSESLFQGRHVICVGNVERNCDERFSLNDLKVEFATYLNPDKLMLVNPGDLNIDVAEDFKPERSLGTIHRIYSKMSLAAPFLAAAKHELLLTTNMFNWSKVDTFIDSSISQLALSPQYLTIIAAPNAVEMSYKVSYPSDQGTLDYYYSADAFQYAKIDGDQFLDLGVGRIFGLTVSDASAYVARSLFYEETLKNDNSVLVTRGMPFITTAANVYAMGKVFKVAGYDTKTTPAGTKASDWANRFYISYNDHGSTNWAGIASSEIPNLDDSFIITLACLTCKYSTQWNSGDLFCSNVIRKGAIGFIGATDVSGYINDIGFMADVFAQGETVGKAFINSKNAVTVADISWENYIEAENYNPMPWYTLIGDPTLKLKTAHTMPAPSLEFVGEDETGWTYNVRAPAMKIIVPEEVKNICEYPGQVGPLYFTTTYNRQLDIAYNFLLRTVVPENLGYVALSGRWEFIKNPKTGETWLKAPYKYYESPEGGSSREDYFQGANDHEFTNEIVPVVFLKKAPDLAFVDLRIENHYVRFKLKNIGNDAAFFKEGWININVFGCSEEECPRYYDHEYQSKFFQSGIDLAPGEYEEYELYLPETGMSNNRLSDYQTARIDLQLYSGEITQQNYLNDKLGGILEIK